MALYSRTFLRERFDELSRRRPTLVMKSAESLLFEHASKADGTESFTIFLSHSYSDSREILWVKTDLEGRGYSVYVDWIENTQMDRSDVTPETADRLRERMKQSACLFYVDSATSGESRWMPWELGYFDAFRGRVAILPIVDRPRGNAYDGQEYLGLYPYVALDPPENSTEEVLWIHDEPETYVSFNRWLKGKNPSEH